MRIGLKNKGQLEFSYKLKSDDPWEVFYLYEADNLGTPIGFDLIGPCAGSNWGSPPEPQCKSEEVSFEIDYVRFYSEAE